MVGPKPITSHATEAYVPDQTRDGIALCLSGGGFRAALFHLGAIRRLYELGVLDQVRTIVAVSGGSTIAAFLAARRNVWWQRGLGPDEWESEIAAPFRRFTSEDLGTKPWLVGWLRPHSNAGLLALAHACEVRGLTAQTTATLPEEPRFLFEATDLVTGRGWLFDSSNSPSRRISLVVAVSSCYPGVFRPFTESQPEHIALVDGGVFDNRGVEPVWKTHRELLVSDGGDVLQPQWGETILWSLIRSARVLFNQSQAMQKRWMISNFISGEDEHVHGTYWDIASSSAHYRQNPLTASFYGYTLELARDVISRVRTAYDAFSSAEAAVLENHGYFMADAAARTHLAQYVRDATSLRVPHPAWLDEMKVRNALRNSGRQRLFGRGFFRSSRKRSILPTRTHPDHGDAYQKETLTAT